MPADCAAFVDKMPGNFRIVGHLLAAFPNARIVHLLRDPRDIALSIWQVYFPAGHPYAYDMARMAHHMNLYARTMARWHTLFPGRIHDLGYADLVADIDGQSRRLAEIAGLDWVPAMARPQNNDRAVLTASSGQVREAVHTRSVGKWRRHEALLAPLVDALNPALWPGLGSA
jgi:hypothetical protein